jgi:uncharacterized protein DUF955
MARDGEKVRRRCRRLIDDLAIRPPITMIKLVDAAARRRNKPIKVTAMRGAPESICGMLLRKREFDCILYDAAASPVRQLHTVAHEVAHLLFKHHDGTQAVDLAQVQALAPGVPQHVVEYVVERLVSWPNPTDQQEIEAETFALLAIAGATTQGRSDVGVPAPLVSAGDLARRPPGLLAAPEFR